MSKFVIFAHARSGSTSLARLLGESKDVVMAIEPFHPGFNSWNPGEKDYSKLIVDKQTMNQAIDDLFSRYTAIKVLNYQLDEELYFELLRRKELKIVFLTRKNLLEAAISNLIAVQTAIWHKDEIKKHGVGSYGRLKPISVKEIKGIVDYTNSMNNMYRKFLLKNRKGGFLDLVYEELYSTNAIDNLENISKICKFIDVALPTTEAINTYMQPSKSKINASNVYAKLPNLKEIEAKLGPISRP